MANIKWIFLFYLNFSHYISSEAQTLNQTERHANLLVKTLISSLDYNEELIDYVIKVLKTVDSYFLHILVEKTVSPILANTIIGSVSRTSSNAVVVTK